MANAQRWDNYLDYVESAEVLLGYIRLMIEDGVTAFDGPMDMIFCATVNHSLEGYLGGLAGLMGALDQHRMDHDPEYPAAKSVVMSEHDGLGLGLLPSMVCGIADTLSSLDTFVWLLLKGVLEQSGSGSGSGSGFAFGPFYALWVGDHSTCRTPHKGYPRALRDALPRFCEIVTRYAAGDPIGTQLEREAVGGAAN